ncbi:MAG TPA: XdhC/CoxI family protein [Acidimicrobiia bacterium]|nr:XdhC/CoxI family protein [Acidimicrobiia bacterium]
MKELLGDIERWRAAGKRAAIARVVDIEGSGPRDPGAAMAVNDAGEVAGSVSGGCVEGAVLTEGLSVLEKGKPKLVTYGIADDDAFAVGLTCGGTIHIFIAPPGDHDEEIEAVLRSGEPAVLATVIEGLNPGARGVPVEVGAKLLARPGAPAIGSLGDPDLDRVVERDALGELEAARTGVRHYGVHGEARREEGVAVFIESFALPPRMVIFGAIDFTAALAKLAKLLGYRVTVCDARAVFATPQRFPMADEVVNDWPDRYLAKVGSELGPRDAVCVLTHDPKFDVPAIAAALETKAGYLGAMGSRRTHDQRMQRLREAGVGDAGIARVMAPVGLDIGARTPEETAVSICAEIIAQRTGRDAPSLRDMDGPIHR